MWTFAACAVGNVASGQACNAAGTCLGNLTQDRFCTSIAVAPGAAFAQGELQWETTQAAGDRLDLRIYWGTAEQERAGDSNGSFGMAMGPSPIVLPIGADAMAEAGLGLGGVGFIPCVYTGFDPAMPAGVTLQQRFTLFTTVFFGYLPPEGWTFGAAGEIPTPPA